MGENARIRHFTIQWQQPNFKNTIVTARGRITAVEDSAEGKLVSLELWTEDNNDRRLANGTAKVLFSA
jgi:hypothetical protein